MKVVGVVKSIVGTDAVIAIDEDGNQRAIFPGDNLYDNEKLLELSGVQVNVEPVTVADAQKKSEPKSDKEVASLQDALLNGKDISELEETAAGAPAGGGNASSDGVSLGAASFIASGHESSIHADANAISEVAPASVAGVTNVSGGAEEFTSSLETLTVANELINPVSATQPNEPVVAPAISVVGETPRVEENTPVAPSTNETPATPITPETSVSGETPVETAKGPSTVHEITDLTWTEPIVVDPSDPKYDHDHHFDDEPTTPVQPTPSEPAANAHISGNIFEITKMYADEDPDLSRFSISKYGNPEDYHDFHPTFEGKADAFADIALTLSIKRYYPDEQRLEYEFRETITTKADANGDWKVETAEEYGTPGSRYSDGYIEAKVTNSAGVTFEPTPLDFYMPLTPIRGPLEDHL